MKKDDPFVTVGKIGTSYGVHGWIKINSFTERSTDILDYNPWYLQQGNQDWQAISVEAGKPHGNTIIVKLKGINTPEAARLLTGALIGVSRSQLPPLKKNEYYWSDLIGLTVIQKDGNVLGTVTHLLATGSNDVLVVKGEKEQAIPFLLNEVILDVDLEKKEIRVDWEELV